MSPSRPLEQGCRVVEGLVFETLPPSIQRSSGPSCLDVGIRGGQGCKRVFLLLSLSPHSDAPSGEPGRVRAGWAHCRQGAGAQSREAPPRSYTAGRPWSHPAGAFPRRSPRPLLSSLASWLLPGNSSRVTFRGIFKVLTCPCHTFVAQGEA